MLWKEKRKGILKIPERHDINVDIPQAGNAPSQKEYKDIRGLVMKQAKEVCKEMLLGLGLWFVAVGLLLLLAATNKFAAIAGLFAGTLAAAGLILHMYHHLDITLDMDAKHARSHAQAAAFQRMAVMAVVLTISMFLSQYLHPVGTVLGLFGVKITALINPKLHAFLQKNRSGRI